LRYCTVTGTGKVFFRLSMTVIVFVQSHTPAVGAADGSSSYEPLNRAPICPRS